MKNTEKRNEIKKAIATFVSNDLNQRTGKKTKLFGGFLKEQFNCPKEYLENIGFENVELENRKGCERASTDGFYLSSNGFCSRVEDI